VPEVRQHAFRYILEYVPNRYSITEENLKSADAVEIKIGQSAESGMGARLPAERSRQRSQKSVAILRVLTLSALQHMTISEIRMT